MPLDLAALATTLVAQFLVPAVKKGLGKIGGDVKETASQAAADGVVKVWTKVKELFSSERDQQRWEDLEKFPEESAPVITRVLEEKLAADPGAARELDEMLHAEVPGSNGATLKDIVAETFGYVDARQAHISGNAQVAGVILQRAAGSPIVGRPTVSGPGPQDH